MSANCEYYESLMSRMLDGDLLPAETDALRDHIRTCESCGRLCAAFSSMALTLREDGDEAPESLCGSVMARIRTWEAEQALKSAEPLPQPQPAAEYRPRAGRTSRKKNRWMPTLAAACLMIVIGGTVVLSLGRGGSKATEAADTTNASAAYGLRSAADAGEPVAEEAVETESAPAEPAEEPMEAADLNETAEDSESAAGYDLANPAAVPEGSEAAFEALLTDAGSMPETGFHAFYAVEYRGVIYEFMTDDSEEYLLWRDAAEGFPTLSQSSFDDLWAIFK